MTTSAARAACSAAAALSTPSTPRNRSGRSLVPDTKLDLEMEVCIETLHARCPHVPIVEAETLHVHRVRQVKLVGDIAAPDPHIPGIDGRVYAEPPVQQRISPLRNGILVGQRQMLLGVVRVQMQIEPGRRDGPGIPVHRAWAGAIAERLVRGSWGGRVTLRLCIPGTGQSV